MVKKTTSWIQTFRGHEFHYSVMLDDLLPQIDLHDICHSLAYTNRFNGHTCRAISVGQHSLAVAALVPKELRLQALLHDAAEAYIGDVPTPLKRHLGPVFHGLEDAIERAIRFKFGLPAELDSRVKRADEIALFYEKHKFFRNQLDWGWDGFEKLTLKQEDYLHIAYDLIPSETKEVLFREITKCL